MIRKASTEPLQQRTSTVKIQVFHYYSHGQGMVEPNKLKTGQTKSLGGHTETLKHTL